MSKIKNLCLMLLLFFSSLSQAIDKKNNNSDNRDPVNENGWTKWLVGEWEGYRESDGNKTKLKQAFKYTLDKKYVYVTLEVGENGKDYSGKGVFWYNNKTKESFGSWFGEFYDTNSGTGEMNGNKVIWNIDRPNKSKVIRIREKISDNEYVVNSTSLNPDGTVRK